MIDLSGAPFPVTYRELWLPRGINENASLPSSRHNGHGLTFTGARKGTTADGVHFNGAVTSNINCGAIHDNAATCWISFRFKLDQPFSVAVATDQYLWGKHVDATHFVWLVLRAADGKLYFEGQDGGANDFSIAAQAGGVDITSWDAGRWYQVYASISAANDVRFRIDMGTVVTVVSAIAYPNGGDFIIGDFDDPGAGTGFEGIITDFFCEENNDLTTTEEIALRGGVPPTTVDNEYLLDEGRGVTAYDRGVDGNNGTLDTSCTWAFSQVQQPVISFDYRNDHAQSSAGVDISGGWTFVWVSKIKTIYDTSLGTLYMTRFEVDANNYFQFVHWNAAANIRWQVVGNGTAGTVYFTPGWAIDDYAIFLGTLSAGGRIDVFVNGSFLGSETGVGAMSGGAATAYIGASAVPNLPDISKPLFVALIDGVFTQKQALAYSRYLKNIFNLPISI